MASVFATSSNRSTASCGNATVNMPFLNALPEKMSEKLGAMTAFTPMRSEEHTSELQSLMRRSYAVFCLKKKKQIDTQHTKEIHEHTQKKRHSMKIYTNKTYS